MFGRQRPSRVSRFAAVGASAGLVAGLFAVVATATPAFAAAPVITSVSPNFGSTAGDEAVTITGTGFSGTSAVTFGTTTVPKCVSPNTLGCWSLTNTTHIAVNTVPSTAGLVDVKVTATGGPSGIVPADHFTYTATTCTFNGLPNNSIINVVPGTTTLAIVCSGLNPSQTLLPAFASPLAGVLTNFSISAATALLPAGFPSSVTSDASGNLSTTKTVPTQTVASDPDATCPPSQDQVNRGLLFCAFAIADINSTNYSNALLQYPGQPTPAIPSLGLAPTTGPSGTSVTVSGNGWWGGGITGGPIPASAISVGGTVASVSTVSEVAPVYTINGTLNGGTLTGGNLTGAFTVPAGAPGGLQTVAVDQVNPGGFPGNGPGNTVEGTASFTVTVPPPTVTSVVPNTGSTAGGTAVVITGTNLSGASAVSFGGNAATSFTPVNATTVNATAPAGAAGTVDVTVTTPGGTSVTNVGDHFTYVTPPPTPVVTGVAPSSGPTTAGTAVVITGTGLTGATAVSFGGTAATGVTPISATQVNATAPAHAAGTVDVTVTTPGGTSATNAGDQYTFVAAPTVTSVAPASGPAAGGTAVVITGTNLTGATAVSFGGTAATSFTPVNATTVNATAPAHAAGVADVRVTTAGGQSAVVAGDHFTFVAAPTVTSVAPSSGTTAGGTAVTIMGTNLTGVSAVSFGGTAAASFTPVSATQVNATSPAGAAGVVDITVTTPGGTSATSAADQFTFVVPPPAPTITSVVPAIGSTVGGQAVVITGTNLTGASAVSFGGTAATSFTPVNATTVNATAPAHAAGTVDITVTTPGGTSATNAGDQFTYVAPPPVPTVTSVVPNSGVTAGGTAVVITGTNLTGASAVSFGGTAATSFTPVNATTVNATAPAHAAGTVDVTVTTGGGTSATNAGDHFTYIATPDHHERRAEQRHDRGWHVGRDHRYEPDGRERGQLRRHCGRVVHACQRDDRERDLAGGSGRHGRRDRDNAGRHQRDQRR